jgi:glutaminyl-peptide cyclotransferase
MRRPGGLSVRVLVLALLLQLALGGLLIWGAVTGFKFLPGRMPPKEVRQRTAATSPAAAPAPRVDRFDGAAAWRELRYEVGLGPRPSGSPTLVRLAGHLTARLPHARRPTPGLQTVEGRLPGRGPGILLAAHIDTKDIPGFVGANDGASGAAVVLEVARALSRGPRPKGAPEVRFVLFDGEESPRGAPDSAFTREGLRGSKAYAASRPRPAAMVLLDMVGDRDLSIPREANSDARLWGRLRASAQAVGTAGIFPDETRSGILDDHIPFVQRGVPAIDLIDFTYPPWHTTGDDLSQVSERSLDAVGETVVELLRRLGAARTR